MHYVNPTAVVDALKKIAGFIKLTDEFLEDAPFLKSEIDGRLLYDLAWFEEQQLLNGNGTGQNVLGLLNRSGIQTETGTSLAGNPDSIFRAITKVSTASGLRADGVVINPTDYQALRLAKDGATSTTAADSSPGSTARAASTTRRCGGCAPWSPRRSPPGPS